MIMIRPSKTKTNIAPIEKETPLFEAPKEAGTAAEVDIVVYED